MEINLNNYYEVLDILFEAMPFVFWKDRTGIYLGGNQNQAKAFGFISPTDFIGKTIFELLDDVKAARDIDANDNEIMESGVPCIIEETIETPFGHKTYLSQKNPIKDSNGNVIGLLGFSLEISNLHRIIDEQTKFGHQARQMMHDITSPISSIDMIIEDESKHLAEASRVSLRNACNRIKDIANNMLTQYSKTGLENIVIQPKKEILVSLAVLQLISEKRTAFKTTGVEFEVKISKDANFVFINMDRSAFQRMLSNVINNGVDALQAHKANNKAGKITITVSENIESVIITIDDNGPGMPKHIQEKFKLGETITEGKVTGHGIGLVQVKDAVDGANGKFMVYANATHGTTIGFTFPRAKEPKWLISELTLQSNDKVVILDDDESIHGAWNNKLSNTLTKYPEIEIKHFTRGDDAIEFINQLDVADKQRVCLLTDYELLNQEVSGLDVITKTNLKRSIVVTSYTVDIKIQQHILNLKAKLLPKELVSHTEIKVTKEIIPNSRTVDMVWVDDQGWYVDDVVNKYYSEMSIDIYTDPDLFLDEVTQYPKTTRIILDTYYQREDGDQLNITGYQLADKLHNLGYNNLILCSGDKPESWDTSRIYLQIIHKESISQHVKFISCNTCV